MLFCIMVNMLFILSLLALAGTSHAHSVGGNPITGQATCDDDMRLYADGVLYPSFGDSMWYQASSITLPHNTRVVAIFCQEIYSNGRGIKATFSNGIRTDNTWKCSEYYIPGWNTTGFDDRSWEYATRATYYDRGNQPSELAGQGDWIWTRSGTGQHRRVYCRKEFFQPIAPPIIASNDISGHATCDNIMWLYTDGYFRTYNDDWMKAVPVSMPADTKVLGIQCRDLHGTGGIKAAFNNGVKTDGSWKCSRFATAGWTLPGYDDRSWQYATVIRDWTTIPRELYGRADWIWTSGYRGQDLIVSCRKEIGQQPVPPPNVPEVPSLPVVYGYDCITTDPCQNLAYDVINSGRIFYPHHHIDSFIECDVTGGCLVKHCAAGLKWNQQARFCVN